MITRYIFNLYKKIHIKIYIFSISGRSLKTIKFYSAYRQRDSLKSSRSQLLKEKNSFFSQFTNIHCIGVGALHIYTIGKHVIFSLLERVVSSRVSRNMISTKLSRVTLCTILVATTASITTCSFHQEVERASCWKR